MKNITIKDIFFVTTQGVLFVLYFIPVFTLTIQSNLLIKLIGLSLTFIGVLSLIVAILQLKTNLTPFPTPVKSGSLIQTGLYKYVRHPIYSGIFLATVGFGLFQGDLWKIVVGFGLIILFYFKSEYEEKLLLKHFFHYTEYRKRTARFIPYL